MDENRSQILGESARLLSKLHLLGVFFGDDILYKIYLRSQVIHQLYEQNPELDINRLELLNLQFTTTIVELLRQIKRNNEKSVSLLEEEIRLNEELIDSLEHRAVSDNDYRLEMQRQELKMRSSLQHLYDSLSNDTNAYPFAKNINGFSARYAGSFFAPVSTELLGQLTAFSEPEVYRNAHAVIQRKLMGLLCKHEFRVHFMCGLNAGSQILEVYRIPDTGVTFIYYSGRNLFLLCDSQEIAAIRGELSERPPDIVEDLRNRTDQLKSIMALAKVKIPPDIRALMADHYKHISDINFLQDIANYDAQANILKAMLNTRII